MHEMAIAEGILDICLDTLKENGGSVVRSIQIHIGHMSGVEPEALTFCFDAVSKGTPAEKAQLEIELVPVTGYCLDCQESFRIDNYVFRCPTCEGQQVITEKGKELKVVSIDID